MLLHIGNGYHKNHYVCIGWNILTRCQWFMWINLVEMPEGFQVFRINQFVRIDHAKSWHIQVSFLQKVHVFSHFHRVNSHRVDLDSHWLINQVMVISVETGWMDLLIHEDI
ncbi:uncharacterized protein LOC108252661 [Diaphorina citri]|uniref:Uncharacterized protein LOC108252661 n=1 Tax=Diaphorina citri TaxID=121845 RepID=A0A1S4EED0_DIACI|nr:uncharacterized protein LOC108252661 [Diaphorina citri]